MTALAPRDTLAFHMVGQAEISPDGSQVAFIEASFDVNADETVWDIRIMPTDGSAPPRRLTTGRRDSLPRWSPDGTRLAFLSARIFGWRQDLYIIDVAGGEPRLAATLPRGVESFAWSPAGDGFALVGRPAYPDRPSWPGQHADLQPPPTGDDEERHARYDRRVVHIDRFGYRESSRFTDDEASQLWWCALDGEPVMLTEGPYPVTDPGWTSDGRLTFVSSRRPDFDHEPFARVWAIDRRGGEPQPLTDEVNALRGYSTSAKGEVAYVGLPVPQWSFGSHDHHLYVDGKDLTPELDRPASRVSEVQSLTLDYLTANRSPVWTPHGVYFHVVDAGCCHVYRLAGDRPLPVVTGKRVIGDFSVGGDTIIFTASSPDEPIALWAADADGGGERLLYDPNPWLAQREVGELRHFSVTLDSGASMDAWAVLPATYDGEALPTILEVHPGPHSSSPWDYHWEHRIIANAGYVVLSCNQPGSQGYGEQFAQELDGRWGEVDLPAYLAVCDEAARLGFTDPQRLGITGATYGGFATLWALAHSDRFKAGVANRPITHLDAMYGDSDIGWLFLPFSLGAEPWEDPELYRRLSPVTYAPQISAPVRFLTFADNGRTTVAAAESVYLRLRKLGVQTDMLVFPPGSATVLMPGRPWSKIAMYNAITEWFDRHL